MLTAWILLGVALAMIAMCGIFVAAEFSFITVSRTEVERACADQVPGAAGIQAGLRTLSTQLSAAQVGITITNLLIGWSAQPSIATLMAGPFGELGLPDGVITGLSFAFALGLSTILTMVFGELVPKNLAIAHPLAVARVVQLPQRWFTIVSRPLTGVLNATSNRIVRLLGIEPQEELASARSAEELVSVVRAAAEEGHLPARTARLVEASLRFDGLHARDALTPRTRVVSVSAGDSVQQVIELAAQHGHSRFPVIGTDLDDVVGVLELSQAVGVPPARRGRVRAGGLSRRPLFVPHTAALDEVLWDLQDADAELAVVLDEYGGMAGIVTQEDLVEEIVGEINDEHDPAADLVRRLGDDWVVSGLLRPDELAAQTPITLPKLPHRYETLAGLVLHRLGRMPQVGDELTIDDVRIVVERMDGHRIDLLRLHGRSGPRRTDG